MSHRCCEMHVKDCATGMPGHFGQLGFTLAFPTELWVGRTSWDLGRVSSTQKEVLVSETHWVPSPCPHLRQKTWGNEKSRMEAEQEGKAVRLEETLGSWQCSCISIHLLSPAPLVSAAYPTFIYLSSAPTADRTHLVQLPQKTKALFPGCPALLGATWKSWLAEPRETKLQNHAAETTSHLPESSCLFLLIRSWMMKR